MSDAYKYNFLCPSRSWNHGAGAGIDLLLMWCPGEHVQEASQMTKVACLHRAGDHACCSRLTSFAEEFLLTVYSKHNGSPNELSLHPP